MGDEKYISLLEASKLCRYSQEYLSFRARGGKLKAVKQGRSWYTTSEWLDEYIALASEARPNFHSASKVSGASDEGGANIPRLREAFSFLRLVKNPAVMAISLLVVVSYMGLVYAGPLSITESIGEKFFGDSLSQYQNAKERALAFTKGNGDFLRSFYTETEKEVKTTYLYINNSTEKFFDEAREEAEEFYASLNEALYDSSFSLGQTAKSSYISTNNNISNSIEKLLSDLAEAPKDFLEYSVAYTRTVSVAGLPAITSRALQAGDLTKKFLKQKYSDGLGLPARVSKWQAGLPATAGRALQAGLATNAGIYAVGTADKISDFLYDSSFASVRGVRQSYALLSDSVYDSSVEAGLRLTEAGHGLAKTGSAIASEYGSASDFFYESSFSLSQAAKISYRIASGFASDFLYDTSLSNAQSAKSSYLAANDAIGHSFLSLTRLPNETLKRFNLFRVSFGSITGSVVSTSVAAQEFTTTSLFGFISSFRNTNDSIERFLSQASFAVNDFATNIGNTIVDGVNETNNFFYTSSFESAATVKTSYLSANNSAERFFNRAYDSMTGSIVRTSVAAQEFTTAALPATASRALQAGIFSPLTSAYQSGRQAYNNINNKVNSFLGNTYLKIVKAVIPGYSPTEVSGIEYLVSSPATDEAGTTTPSPVLVREVIREIQTVKEITKEVIKIDDTKLLTIEGDISTLQSSLASLQATVVSQNLSFTNSRLDSLETFILASNRTVPVSPQNNTQIKYLLNNITAISLELQTHSDRVGLLVNQRGTSNIIQFQDKGTDILTIADGGATTINSQNQQIQFNAGSGEIDLTTTGTVDINATTFDINSGTLDFSTQRTAFTLNNIVDSLNFDSNTFSIDALNNRIGIGTTTPSSALDVSGAITSSGQTTITRAPSTAHTFASWAIDTANSAVTDASFLINATSSTADANLFGLAVNGNVKFLIDAEGDVFVNGLTTAGSVTQGNTTISTLTVENNTTLGDASTDTLTFNASTLTIPNGLNIATSTLYIDPNNKRVGIGTMSPARKLHIQTGSSFGGTPPTGNGMILENGGTVFFAILTPNNKLGEIDFGDPEDIDVGRISYDHSDNSLRFRTAAVEQLVIDSTGNVGIGDTTPDFLLDIESSSSASTTLSIDNTSTGDAQLLFRNSGVDEWFIGYDDSQADVFRITDTAFSATNATGLTIEAGGNVGIGTTNPAGLLHLNGSGEYTVEFTRDGQESYDILHGTSGLFTRLSGVIVYGAGQNHDFQVFDNGGTPYATFDGSTGLVGIGDTSPDFLLDIESASSASTTLSIDNTSTGDAQILFRNSGVDEWFIGYDDSQADVFRITDTAFSATNATGLTIESGGNVGIGTTSPLAALHVEADDSNSQLVVADSVSTATVDRGGTIKFYGRWSTGLSLTDFAEIRGAKQNSANGQADGYLAFLTRDGGSGLAERVRITDIGFVGIGDSSPDSILDIEDNATGASVSDVVLTINNASTTAADPYINFQTGGTSRWRVGIDDSASDVFRITDTAFSATNATGLTIASGGNVGIGTTSPSNTLEVVGTNSATNFKVTGLVTGSAHGSDGRFTLASGTVLHLFDSNVEIGRSGTSLQLKGNDSIQFLSSIGNERMRITSSGNVGIGDTSPGSLLTLSSTGANGGLSFGDINDNIIDNMEATTINWASSDTSNTATSTETSIVRVGTQALKFTTTESASSGDTVRRTYSSNQDWSAFERISFWIRATQTSTTTDQIVSIQLSDTSTGILDHNITMNQLNAWQYEEWDLSATTTAAYDAVTFIQFVIDQDTDSPTFYIDHIRLYDNDERSGELFVDADGNVVIMGRGGVDIFRPSTGSGQIASISVNSATVEINQPLSVNVGGNVGFDYDIELLNTSNSRITSQGNLWIQGGDPNGSDNLYLDVRGTGDIIVDIQDSNTTSGGFKVIGTSAPIFRISPNGRVGIGFADPDTLLHIEDPNGGASANDVVLTINNASTTAAADPYIDFQTGGTSRWRVGVDDSQSDVFRISQGNAAFNATSSGITIDGVGNVGIGTTNPTGKLQVVPENGGPILFGNPSDTGTWTGGILNQGPDNGVSGLLTYPRSDANSVTPEDPTHGVVLRFEGGTTDVAELVSSDTLIFSTNQGANLNTNFGTNERMRIDTSGRVGIATTTPARALSVQGGALVCSSGDASCPTTETAGDIYATTRSGGAIDVAEWIKVVDSQVGTIEAGDVIVASNEAEKVEKSSSQYQANLLGVVSTRPHLTMGTGYAGEDAVRIALIGRLPVKVSLENGPISPGDRITSSNIPGVGMRATEGGNTIGIALEAYDPDVIIDVKRQLSGQADENGVGKILIFLNLGYQKLTVQEGTDPELASSEITLKSLATKQDELEQRVAALELKLDSAGSLTLEISNDKDQMSNQIQNPNDQNTFLASLKDALETLGAKIQDGILEIKQIVTGKLVIEQADPLTSSTSTLSQNTIGEGVILAGATSTSIQASIIGVYDKVFVTPEMPVAMGVVERTAGEGFVVGVAEPALEDVYFDWWIVAVKITSEVLETTATSTESNATTTSENLESGILNLESTTTDSGVNASSTPQSGETTAGQADSGVNASTTDSGVSATTTDSGVNSTSTPQSGETTAGQAESEVNATTTAS